MEVSMQMVLIDILKVKKEVILVYY